MSISQILILIFLALILGQIKHTTSRNISILVLSLLFYYHYQSTSPILYLDFWLPTLAICMALFIWITSHSELRAIPKTDLPIILLSIALILAVSANRYLAFCCITPTKPPQLWIVVIFLALVLGLPTLLLSRWSYRTRLSVIIFTLIILFILLKTPSLSMMMSQTIRLLNQQDPRFSSITDLSWLGISYILLRMIHLLLDWRAGRLASTTLTDVLSYLFFFPTLLAGPIARFPQFREQIEKSTQYQDLIEGVRRIFIGLIRKFVLADSLALLSLSPQNAPQIHSPAYLWFALFAYSLRIYFDFSGYTDIAIGSARLMGIRLPENFNAPYLKTSLIQFWNSWHITLADWFRSYVFYPLTRKLRSTPALPPRRRRRPDTRRFSGGRFSARAPFRAGSPPRSRHHWRPRSETGRTWCRSGQ